ncbi:EAL domain-containing protein [Bowmanella denitrificans]|uniref:EAL domain-containing protein n=1 Tax=Bowmanella denitrificans TaxID=366582 RepID=A0ABN0WYJ3_9ALTE
MRLNSVKLAFLGTIFCLGLLFSPWSRATTNLSNIQFKNYSVSDGLSQSTILDIAEDKQGFIWLATVNGLNRFDGYQFKQYHLDANNPNSLPDKFVRQLYVDQQGTLWVATNGGLACYNAHSDNFTRFNSQNTQLADDLIVAISRGLDGKLWVTDKNHLYEYDEKQQNFHRIRLANTEIFPETKSILVKDDRLWLGSYGHGIQIYQVDSNSLYKLDGQNPWELQIDASFLHDIKVINNQYWLATEQGVYILNEQLQLLRHLHTGSQPAIVSNLVQSIEQDADNDVWLGTSEGLSIVNPTSYSSLNIDQRNDALVSLDNRYVFKLLKDSNDSIWLGSFTGGIYQYNERSAFIKHYQAIPHSDVSISDNMVWAFSEAQNGNIWIATQSGGLNLFEPTSAGFKHYLSDFPHSIWDLALDEQDRIWLATIDGIFIFKLNDKGQLLQLQHLLPGQLVDSIQLSGGFAWIWTTGTLSSINIADFSFSQIPVPNKQGQLIKPNMVDSHNNVWLASNDGISLYNLDNGQFSQPAFNINGEKLPLGDTNAILEGPDFIWVSSFKNGLYKLDKQSYKIVQHYSRDNGLSDNGVLTMLLDDNAVWIATTAGIDQISRQNGQLVQHIPKDLLDYNELNESAGLITRKGDVLFGGTKGFHIFNPNRLTNVSKLAVRAPKVTGLSIFNQEVGVGEIDSPLTRPVYQLESIELENKASPFSLTFALINPVNPRSVSYRYQMQGLSDQWLEADHHIRQATFTNLGFGNYHFRVQARELDGPWSPPAELAIHIKAPTWLHQSALLAYGLVAFLLLSYWFRQYKLRRVTQRRVRDSEERLKLTLWSSGDELWDWDIAQAEVTRANIWGVLDFPQDNHRVATQLESNIHKADLDRVRDCLSQHLKGKSEYYETTYRVKDFKGDWQWILDRGKVVSWDANQNPLRMTGTLKNISHLKQAEEQLRLFKRSIETISDGVFITDTTFRIISVNQAFCNHTGETREQALASYLSFHQYPTAFTDEVRKTLRHKGNWSGEIESLRQNGERYEIDLNIDAIHSDDGSISHYVGVFSDITSRKRTEKELLQLANTDTLTGLPNRSFFQASHQNLVRKGMPHALLCMDMDNFKKINDSMGHQTGDLLIKQIAARLQKITGTNATCYRLGGDEFSVLVENSTDIHRITHLAQRILDEMARSFIISRQEFVLGGSLGIAFYPEDGASPQELLKNADTAMYFAKNAGGNKYQFFSGEMNQNAVRQLQIENLIRHGIKEDLFSVYYQPKVDIASGQLVSMEALVRFEHPEKGIVSPDQFIPLAEETGQIIEIGDIVLRKACEDTQRWVKQGLFSGRVAINISARQFELPDLDQRIEQVLRQTGLSPLHLECEITEGTLMQRPEQSLELMQRLREMGIHLALDDFGTGYSSLAYLKRFPLNTLKIDKAFIDDIATSAVDRHMTSAIITIAHNLGLKVVAEGVEEEQQLSILRRYECEMLQGYLYSKPLSSERFTNLLQENRRLNKLIKQNNY